MKRLFLALAFSLIASPVMAAPLSPVLIRNAVDCMRRITGLPVPKVLPTVSVSHEWALQDDGRELAGSYNPLFRHITLAQGRTSGTLVHELTHDAYRMSISILKFDPIEDERIAHEAGEWARKLCPDETVPHDKAHIIQKTKFKRRTGH